MGSILSSNEPSDEPGTIHPFDAQFPVWSQFVVPWSTIPVVALYMCVLCLMRDIESEAGTGRDFYLGVLAVSILVIRPVDALVLLSAGPVYLWSRLRRNRSLAHLSAGLAGVLVVAVPAVLLTVLIHGGLQTPYVVGARSAGMSASNLHERAYAIW